MAILRQCLESDVGIEILVETDPSRDVVTPTLRAKQVLYRFKSQNPDYAGIQVRLSPDDPDHKLWLINTGAKLPFGDEPLTVLVSGDDL
jgi:hypothetical protein